MRARKTILAGAAAMSAVALSACAIQEKYDQTASIVKAANATRRLGLTEATLAESVRPHDVNGRHLTSIKVGGLRVDLPSLRFPTAAVSLDLAHKRAVVVPTPSPTQAPTSTPAPLTGAQGDSRGAPAGLGNAATLASSASKRIPLAIAFSDWDIFVRPNTAAVASGLANQAGDSTWLWLDVGDLESHTHTSLTTPLPTLVIAPHILIRLLNGTLTGSVRRLGREDVASTPTTRYHCNLDRDKAAHGLNDRDTERLKRLFDAADIEGTFYEGADVWISDAGIVRRMRVTFQQRIDALTSFDLTYELELGAPATKPLPLPSADDLAQVPTMPELLPGPST